MKTSRSVKSRKEVGKMIWVHRTGWSVRAAPRFFQFSAGAGDVAVPALISTGDLTWLGLIWAATSRDFVLPSKTKKIMRQKYLMHFESIHGARKTAHDFHIKKDEFRESERIRWKLLSSLFELLISDSVHKVLC